VSTSSTVPRGLLPCDLDAVYDLKLCHAHCWRRSQQPCGHCHDVESAKEASVCTGITSANAPPPPSVRMVKLFDEAEARRQLEAAEAEIRRCGARRRARRQQLMLAGHAAAAMVALLCVVTLVRRRRVGQTARSSSGSGIV
jgi:hypothetical protein